MTDRTKEIMEAFKLWLSRFTAPAHLRCNDAAREDETTAMLNVVLRSAPQSGYRKWVEEVLEDCSLRAKTRVWPTVHEINTVCLDHRQVVASNRPQEADGGWNRLDLLARQIEKRCDVGENQIFGSDFARLIREGKITENDRLAYVKAWFAKLDRDLKPAEAAEKKAELERRYAAALASAE